MWPFHRREQLFTRSQVGDAVSDAAALVVDGLDLDERDVDLLLLTADAALVLLDQPDASLDQVADQSWSAPLAEVRTWWTCWS